jgi:hypothetical protein
MTNKISKPAFVVILFSLIQQPNNHVELHIVKPFVGPLTNCKVGKIIMNFVLKNGLFVNVRYGLEDIPTFPLTYMQNDDFFLVIPTP